MEAQHFLQCMISFLSSIKYYSPHQFALWRIFFGVYLAYYFFETLPFAKELYSSEGIFPDPAINWTYGYFPNILNYFDSPNVIYLLLWALLFFSVCLMVGLFRRTSAVILWYGIACLMNRNILTIDPSLHFIGWLLLALAVIPRGEPLSISFRSVKKEWFMPGAIYWGAWFVLGLAYTVSGIDRFQAPSWQNGLAVKYLLELPLAYDSFWNHFLLSFPTWLFKFQSWLAAGMFLTALPLILIKRIRFYVWVILTGMFFYIFTTLDLAQVLLGVFLFHFFLFDSQWLRPREQAAGTSPHIIFYDDTCNLCSWFIRFVALEDHDNRYAFAGFHSETAKKYLTNEEIEAVSALVFFSDNQKFYGGEASINIVNGLGGIWYLSVLGYALPKRFRESLYGAVSTRRYRWFGQREVCLITDLPKELTGKVLP